MIPSFPRRSPAKAGVQGYGVPRASMRWALGSRLRGNTWLSVVALLLATPAAAQTQAQMNADAGAAWKRADAAMTAQWKRTYAEMKAREKTGEGFAYAAALLNAQRAWLKFRDAHCSIAAAEFEGGSLQPMARVQCLAGMTDERTRQLKGLMWQR